MDTCMSRTKKQNLKSKETAEDNLYSLGEGGEFGIHILKSPKRNHVIFSLVGAHMMMFSRLRTCVVLNQVGAHWQWEPVRACSEG